MSERYSVSEKETEGGAVTQMKRERERERGGKERRTGEERKERVRGR